jgi:hypothetical protein
MDTITAENPALRNFVERSSKKQITGVSLEAGAQIGKKEVNRGFGDRPKLKTVFYVPVIYTLEDGTTVRSAATASKKMSVLPTVQNYARHAAAGELAANYWDGEYQGVSITCRIG